jgi:hypothetical protein
MPRFWQVIRGRKLKDMGGLRPAQGYRYGNYIQSDSYSHTLSARRCPNCSPKLLCAAHAIENARELETREEDEERLYIHKRVSIEMTSQNSQEKSTTS